MDCLLLFDQKNLIECNAWDYQLHDYFMVPVTIMYFDNIGPCMYFINEYEYNEKDAGRTLVHKYLAELDDNHIQMHIHFEIEGWTDPDSFLITSNNLKTVKKTIYLFDDIIKTLKDIGQIPKNFNFHFDDSNTSCDNNDDSKNDINNNK